MDSQNSKSLASLHGVEVSYPLSGGGRKIVLANVDLEIQACDFITVVGPSGCGKSTLLRLLLGSQFPTQGEAKLRGAPITGVDRDRGIVYQHYGLFPNLSVIDNIAFGPLLHQTNLWQRSCHTPGFFRCRRKAREEARAYIEHIGLKSADVPKYPHELSGGMRQRVAIAQSLIMKPSILLMDEPFGALDASTREDMQMFILEQWEEHQMTVLFVTHDLEEACYLGSRIIALSQFWSDDQGVGRGAKIVTDRTVSGEHPKPLGYKSSAEFLTLRSDVHRLALDP